jgi:hypothetical protein
MDRMTEAKEWFDIADGDLRSAEHLMTLQHDIQAFIKRLLEDNIE